MKRWVIAALILIFFAAPVRAGLDEGWAAYLSGDYETAYNEWLPRAEEGDAIAQFKIGSLYLEGQGVARDYVRAHMWFTIADVKMALSIVSAKMTPEQIAEAQRLAREWLEEHEQ